MRRRFVAAFVGLAVAVIVLFGLARGYVVAQLVTDGHQDALERSAEVAAFLVSDAAADGRPVTEEMLSAALDEDQRLEYELEGQPPVVVPQGGEPAADGDLTAERAVDGGTVTVSVPRASLRGDVVDALSPLVLLALLLVALSGLVGWLLGRSLSRPFTELAGVAESFGRGHLDTAVPHYDLAEADAIARALEDSSQRLQRMVRRERELSDHASHDLRTPITALRLTLEDLSLWPVTPPEVAAELTRIVAEVDRFSDAVTTLVEAPVEDGAVELVDVAELVRRTVRERARAGDSPAFRVEADRPALARLDRSRARQALVMLLEEAATGAEDGQVLVEVLDGHGYVRTEVHGATSPRGVVWDQAVGLVVELGGRLTSGQDEDGVESWSLVLPEGHDPTAP